VASGKNSSMLLGAKQRTQRAVRRKSRCKEGGGKEVSEGGLEAGVRMCYLCHY